MTKKAIWNLIPNSFSFFIIYLSKFLYLFTYFYIHFHISTKVAFLIYDLYVE